MILKNDIFIYFVILISLIFTAFFSIQLYIFLALIFSLLYLPVMLSLRYYKPLKKRREEEKIAVGEDIAHFRKVVEGALEGKSVAQRDVELRLLNSFVVTLSIRYDLPENLIRRNLDNVNFLRKYVGERAEVVARMYERRHELKLSLPREKFLREIGEIMEAMK